MKTITRRGFCRRGLAVFPVLHLTAAERANQRQPPRRRATIAKEGLRLRVPDRGTITEIQQRLLDGIKTNPEYKGPFKPDLEQRSCLHAPLTRRSRHPTRTPPYSFGRARTCVPSLSCSPCRRWKRERYFSVQLIDYYTFQLRLHRPRAVPVTEAAASCSPGRDGRVMPPRASRRCFAARPNLRSPPIETQLFDPGDIENVRKVQAGYQVQPLSAFSRPACTPRLPRPLISSNRWRQQKEKTLAAVFLTSLNFVLQFPARRYRPRKNSWSASPRSASARARPFDASKLSPEMKTAIEQGMADAWVAFAGLKKDFEEGKLGSGDVFGTRNVPKGELSLTAWRQPYSAYTAIRSRRRCIRLITLMRRSRSWTVPTVTPCIFAAGQLPPVKRVSGR